MIGNINFKINLFKPRKEKIKNYEPSAPPEYNFSIKMTKIWCVGEKHFSITDKISQYEKVNPKTEKFVKFIKGNCSICGRNKSQFFKSK